MKHREARRRLAALEGPARLGVVMYVTLGADGTPLAARDPLGQLVRPPADVPDTVKVYSAAASPDSWDDAAN